MRRERFAAWGKTMGAAFWAVLSGAYLAGACASSAARQEAGEERIPVQEKKSSAAELLEQLPSHDDVAVSVRIGIEHWDTGEITLTLRGSGESCSGWPARRADSRATSMTKRLGRIGADLARQGFTSIRAREGNRLPDDVPVFSRSSATASGCITQSSGMATATRTKSWTPSSIRWTPSSPS